MLDVSRVLYNPKFNQSFLVHRKTGSWVQGRFVETNSIPITFYGVILPATTKQINQLPEGDRTSGIMAFYSPREMFVTHKDNGQGYAGTSDQIERRGDNYKILQVKPYGDYGYFVALGTMM